MKYALRFSKNIVEIVLFCPLHMCRNLSKSEVLFKLECLIILQKDGETTMVVKIKSDQMHE